MQSATVQTDTKEKDYVGARAHTNNTGELSAMHYSLCSALQRPPGEGKAIIWSDSLYTINMTTGRWIPKCKRNRVLIENLYDSYGGDCSDRMRSACDMYAHTFESRAMSSRTGSPISAAEEGG